MVTSIQISDELWKELNKLKKRGDTYENVIRDLLKRKSLKKK